MPGRHGRPSTARTCAARTRPRRRRPARRRRPTSTRASRRRGPSRPTCRSTRPARPSRTSRRSAPTSTSPKLDLYGESYGTQFVQTYAAAHPDRIATLYLDGPVDLTLDGASYYAEATRSFDGVLVATLNACATRPGLRGRLRGQGPARRLRRPGRTAGRGAAITFDFPKGDGTTEPRTLTRHRPRERRHRLPVRGDGPPAAPARAGRGVRRRLRAARPHRLRRRSPSTPTPWRPCRTPRTPTRCTTRSSARTTSTRRDETTDEARLAGFLADARAMGVADARLGDVYYEDIPCLYWPNRPAADPRPAPIVDAPYPTIVMVATADPITPVSNAIRIANRLTRRPRDHRDRRPARDLRLGPLVPGRPRGRLHGQGQGDRRPGDRLRGLRRGRLRPAREGRRGRLRGRRRLHGLAGRAGAQHRRLRLRAGRGPDPDGLRLRRRARLHAAATRARTCGSTRAS